MTKLTIYIRFQGEKLSSEDSHFHLVSYCFQLKKGLCQMYLKYLYNIENKQFYYKVYNSTKINSHF